MYNGQVIVASQSDSLLETLINLGIDIDHSCGGNATCGTCVVKVISGSVNPPNEVEMEFAAERGLSPGERLACQLTQFGGCEIKKGFV